MTSEIKQLHNEVKMIRRDLQEIKAMLVSEVPPTREEIKAIKQGRKEFTRGEFVIGKISKRIEPREPFPNVSGSSHKESNQGS